MSQHNKYICLFCGKESIKRIVIGIWKCRKCKKIITGGAWTLTTQAAVAVRGTINRLRDMSIVLKEENKTNQKHNIGS